MASSCFPRPFLSILAIFAIVLCAAVTFLSASSGKAPLGLEKDAFLPPSLSPPPCPPRWRSGGSVSMKDNQFSGDTSEAFGNQFARQLQHATAKSLGSMWASARQRQLFTSNQPSHRNLAERRSTRDGGLEKPRYSPGSKNALPPQKLRGRRLLSQACMKSSTRASARQWQLFTSNPPSHRKLAERRILRDGGLGKPRYNPGNKNALPPQKL